MNSLVILLDDINDWKPYQETNALSSVSDYLTHKSSSNEKKLVINLSNDYSYNSGGYYCSLLAQTRGHRIIPGIDTINKMEAGTNLRLTLALQKICHQWIEENCKNEEFWYLNIYFGTCKEQGLEKIARYIFDNYPFPILKVCFNTKSFNQIEWIKYQTINQLSDEEQNYFADALDNFSHKVWRKQPSSKSYRYSLAILYDPEEKYPPSNKRAIAKFVEIGKRMDINVELITEEEATRLMEFDALFIRTTTSLNHYTFHLSEKAQQNGLVVIDDPLSIIRCTNKVYLNELFVQEKIPAPLSSLVFSSKRDDFETLSGRLGSPFILKIPDGSFSFGMKKVTSQEELDAAYSELFKDSSILLAQRFVPTDFDWRVGIINKEVIFVCKYYMAKGHWQIYNHDHPGRNECGNFETLPIYKVPRKIISTALKAASLIGDGLYGVDMKMINNKAVVIEINDNPNIDYGVEDAVLGDDLYYRVLKYFVHKIDNYR